MVEGEYAPHGATTWKVVSNGATSIVVLSMCKCGDDNCSFVVTAYKSDVIWQPAPR